MSHLKTKLKYLTAISLKRKIKTKWFLIANILLAVVIAGLINIDSIITFFGGDFDKITKIYVIDETEEAYEILKEQIHTNSINFSGEDKSTYEVILSDTSKEQAMHLVEEDKDALVFIVKPNDKTVLEVSLLSDGYMDAIDFQLLSTAVNNTKTTLAIQKSNLTEEEFNRLYTPVEIERIYLDENKRSEDENMEMVMTTVFPIIILPFFMLTLFLVQMIGAEVNDEKTTRGMEIIISNVSPKIHFFSKVISGNLFVIFQGILLIFYAGIGLLIRKLLGGGGMGNILGGEVGKIVNNVMGTEFVAKLLYIIPLALIIMLLTFLAYSLLAGILASMTTNTEDFQQLQTPIVVISLVGYYLAMMAGVFDGALFIRIFSYIPLISAILSPTLLVLGQISVVDIIISIMIMIGTIYLLIKYGLKIYKVGILNYSSKDLWKKMFKALKSKS